MTSRNRKPLPIKLECGDQRWFLSSHFPEPGDDIWCPKCGRYTKATITPKVESIEGDWKWTPIGNKYFVECIKTLPNGEPCKHSFTTGQGWYKAEEMMNRHLLNPPHASGKFTSHLEIRSVDYGGEPPF